MPFVPGCEHDIFVSYAHVDDQPLPGAEKGWVSTLVEGLRKQLAGLLGRSDAFSLWMDPQIARNESFSSQILETLRQTAILVVIFSPGYVASPWCRRERDTFLSLVGEKVRAGSRIFLVELNRVDLSERPPELSELLGFRFWTEREGHAPRTLGMPQPLPEKDTAYYDRLNDLSHALADELRKLRQASAEPTARAAPPAAAGDARPAVFLAHVTDDLDPVRDEVSRYLDQAGLRVLPERYYSLEPEAFREALRQDLGQCELFVQLLSELPGKRPPALPHGYGGLQLEEAEAAGKRILQWRRPELEVTAVADPLQRELLAGERVLAVGIEEFKREVRQSALRPPPAPPQPINAFVFVNMESSDRGIAEEICELLVSHGVDYVLPQSSGDPADIRGDLEQNLAECDALILIYGRTTVGWVREQLRQCRKALATRERPLRAIAVYEGPPDEKDPLGLKLRNMTTLDGRDCLKRSALESFLASLGNEAAP